MSRKRLNNFPKGTTKGGTYCACVSRQKATNSRIASLTQKSELIHNQPAVAVKTPPAALPNIAVCIQLGLVRPPALVPRKRGLSKTEHTRRRRANFYAAGLTARGTPRQRREYPRRGINLLAPLEADARIRSTFYPKPSP